MKKTWLTQKFAINVEPLKAMHFTFLRWLGLDSCHVVENFFTGQQNFTDGLKCYIL